MFRSAFSKTSGFSSGSEPRRVARGIGPAARRALAFGLVFLVTGSFAGGCSRQGEGERCDLAANGDGDCDDGLICVSKVGNVDRCCPPEGAEPGDSRCAVANAPPGGSTGGTSSGGTNASGGSGGTSGGSSGGTAGGSTGGTTETPSGGSAGSAGADSAGSAGQAESAAGTSAGTD
jgi:hypothetical protein